MRRHARIARFDARSIRPSAATSQGGSLAAPEQLEGRMLLAGDLLTSLYEPTGGMSVVRYDDSFQQVAGGVATGSGGLQQAQGVAVAPDGSYYVSSLSTASVIHYGAYGNYLGQLGENDTTHATFYAPGSLQFGPNGHLYVGDLGAGTIYQFDTTSSTQQFLPASTLVTAGPGVGGFAIDASGDIIVGNLLSQSVTRYDSGGSPTVLISAGSGIVPSAILVQPNGDLLISDIDFGGEPMGHHQILRYDIGTGMTSQFINLTFPVGTGDAAGNAPQPTSMIYGDDGNLLIGVSPDHNQNGAVLNYNSTTGAYIDTLVTGIGTPAGLALSPPVPTGVVGRHIFYNGSKYDGFDPTVNPQDDAAIAIDKTAYQADDGIATPANATSFALGITGIMVDVPVGGTFAESDFIFKVGANNSPDTWAAAPAPSTVVVRPGAGTGGADRVEITWPAFSLVDTWLEVTVKGNDAVGGFDTNTGLSSSDVFYFGNIVADAFIGSPETVFSVNASDEIGARTNGAFNVDVTNVYDFNKDMLVNTADEILARNHSNYITRIDIVTALPNAQPAAAIAGDESSGVASALARRSAVQADVKSTGAIAWAPFALPKLAANARHAVLAQARCQ